MTRSGVLTRVSLSITGVLASLLIAEVALRILGVSFLVAFRGDPETGLQHVANAEGWYRDEGGSYVQINSAGFRDVERTIAKRPDTLRIAVLGDSFTEGFQVDQEQTFTAVAERALQSCAATAGRPVEVLNFGVSSYSTAQELILLRDRVVDYRPDIVVVAFTEGTDVSDDSLELAKIPDRPYFVDRSGELILDTGYRNYAGNQVSPLLDAYFWLLPRSRVLQVFHNARSALTETRIRAENRTRALAIAGGVIEDYSLPRGLFQEPRDPAWIQAWDITERLLREMQLTALSRGARFLVMAIPTDLQAYPDAAERSRVAGALGVTSLDYADDRIRLAGARDGYDVLALAPSFADQVSSTREFLYGFGDHLGHGHWNVSGHRLAGLTLAATICNEITPR